MSRIRRRINAPLPKYVYRRSYGFIYRPYLGMENGARKYGKEVNLCPANSTVAQVYEAYERETRQENNTLRWLLKEYHASPKFKGLKPRTQTDYAGYRDILLAYPMANGKPFGGALLVKIKRTAIQKYLDKYPAPISANRQVQYLKAAWNWAMNRYEHVPENPCIGVELNKQEARTRYVTQSEYRAFISTQTAYVPLFMELAYLGRARWGEVAGLKVSDILPEGLRLHRGKGSEGEITAQSPRLNAVIAACREYNKNAPSPLSGAYLIHDKAGLPIRQNTFQTAWGRAMRAWVKNGGERFTFHDLKAAGYSDQKKQDAGHRSEKMHRTYSRKLRIVEPAE
jgi:integrase